MPERRWRKNNNNKICVMITMYAPHISTITFLGFQVLQFPHFWFGWDLDQTGHIRGTHWARQVRYTDRGTNDFCVRLEAGSQTKARYMNGNFMHPRDGGRPSNGAGLLLVVGVKTEPLKIYVSILFLLLVELSLRAGTFLPHMYLCMWPRYRAIVDCSGSESAKHCIYIFESRTHRLPWRYTKCWVTAISIACRGSG